MHLIVRTVSGHRLQTALLTGLPLAILEHTTLNEKFGIQEGIYPTADQIPRFGYFGIGNMGHTLSVGADQIPVPEIRQHLATHNALFNQIPFALRALNNDLPVERRNKYGLRKEVMINGTRYIAYYLKRVDRAGLKIQTQLRTIRDGQATSAPYVPDLATLSPNPSDLNPSGTNQSSGSFVVTSATFDLSLDAAEVADVCDACNIIYGNPNRAIISEIALVSGVDKLIQVNAGTGQSFQFNEVIGAQVISFVGANTPLMHSRDGAPILIDVGAMEPLYKLE